MRCSAFAMGAQVWHDDPEPGVRQTFCMTKFDPVGMRVGEQPVEQDHGTALTHFMDLQSNPVEGRKIPAICGHHLALIIQS